MGGSAGGGRGVAMDTPSKDNDGEFLLLIPCLLRSVETVKKMETENY